MRKAVTSIVVVAFSGMVCTSILAVFSGSMISLNYFKKSQLLPYFIDY